ncbi:ribosomal protein L4 [Tuber magnatum]|uniref:Large ribosomal subunit protein uL4m n=1 Tax=Tuber magnatum TaxID=42249 RepID=A0A317SYH1_9PEZI|nr:ribosomal protein L4 [Tuber magnatum]
MASRTAIARTSLLGGKRVGTLQDLPKLSLVPRCSKFMATEVEGSGVTSTPPSVRVLPPEPPAEIPFAIRKPPTVLATIYRFPTLEPLRFQSFPTTFLHLPTRRDILHRAITYEGDAARSGNASTKWRGEVRGSGRKIRPQKGTGRARLGDKKSPMLRGGGVAHGPKPRDFSTDLPKKMYNLAWRTAFSYRYRRGQLVVVEDALEIQTNDPGLANSIIKKNGWGNENSRSLFIANEERPNFMSAMEGLGSEGLVRTRGEVDVKDLLEMGRIVIEREALEWFQKERS